MELYALYFAILALFNAAFAHHRHTKSSKRPLAESSSARDDEEEDLSLPIGEADLRSARNFKLTYFGVYTLVMAADWLQASTHLSGYSAASAYPKC